jgi:hypothetical protein
MRFVIAIDVGIKNLGICVFDFASAKFVFWDNVSLVPNGRYIPSNNVQYVRDFISRHQHFFDEASCVLVERQMRCNMRIIESVLQTLYFDICIVINARSIKAHYGIGTKNYRMNKERAVEWADQFVKNNSVAFAPGATSAFETKTKKDDIADSLLMITYYLDTYSNQLSSEEYSFSAPGDELI